MHVYGLLYNVDFIFDDFMMERQGKTIMITEIKRCIIEGDPTYLVINYLLIILIDKVICPIS